MNLLPMQYYLEVVKDGSISRAAERLHITQQTLSAHIAALEKELGCTLFHRRPRFALTHAGCVFRDYAFRFVGLYESMTQEFRDLAGEEAGELSVGVAYTRGRFLLPPILAAYQRRYPKIRIRLIEADNEELIARLRDGRVDLIIANLASDEPLFSVAPFYDEEMILLVPAALLSAEKRKQIRRGDLRALADCPFLMNRREDIAGRIGNAVLAKNGVLPRVAVSSENMETLLDLCLAGEGACFCPKNLAQKVFEGKDYSHLLRVSLDASFSLRLAWQRKPYVRRALTDFVAICRENAPTRET